MVKQVELTRGFFALVDDEDYEMVINKSSWCAHDKKRKTLYAIGSELKADGKTRTIKMHRFILGIDDPAIWVDHKDGNGLNNTRDNLRICSRNQNQQNRPANSNNKSGYKGVYFDSRRELWIASIMANRKPVYLGRFQTPEEAAAAYAMASEKLHKEFSNNG